MENRGSTLILTNLVGVHPRNIHTKFEANPCRGLREEVEKLRKVHATDDDNDGHSLIAGVTHSLSVTKNHCIYSQCMAGTKCSRARQYNSTAPLKLACLSSSTARVTSSR